MIKHIDCLLLYLFNSPAFVRKLFVFVDLGITHWKRCIQNYQKNQIIWLIKLTKKAVLSVLTYIFICVVFFN